MELSNAAEIADAFERVDALLEQATAAAPAVTPAAAAATPPTAPTAAPVVLLTRFFLLASE